MTPAKVAQIVDEDVDSPEIAEEIARPLPYTELTEEHLLTAIGQLDVQIAGDLKSKEGTLVHLATLEGPRWCVPLAKVTPNPTQPRKHFDKQGLKELAGSIGEEGQKTPISVVPFVDGKGSVSFFLIGGERRWRALNMLKATHAIITITWESNEASLFRAAYLDNYHKPINVVDEARSIEHMISDIEMEYELSRAEALEKVARIAGYSVNKIRQLLKLVKLVQQHPDMEEHIIEGRIRPANVIHLARGRKRGRKSAKATGQDALLQELAARKLLDNLSGYALPAIDEDEGAEGSASSPTKERQTTSPPLVK